MSRDAETDRCLQLANGFLILAEKGLSAFMSSVGRLFGAEQARQSAPASATMNSGGFDDEVMR